MTRTAAIVLSFVALGVLFGLPLGAAEPGPWHVSLFGDDGRVWLPEADFPPAVQKAPFMVIWEVSRYSGLEEPSAEQRAASEELRRRSLEVAERQGWFDFEQAQKDGYELLFRDEVHYFNREYVNDGRTLDPERPEFLMFYDTPKGKQLVGYMYLASTPTERGPQVGGPDTVWHYHIWAELQCLEDGLLVAGDADPEGRCSKGVPTYRSPEMIHVWFVDHPQGPFATNMKLPDWLLAEIAESDS